MKDILRSVSAEKSVALISQIVVLFFLSLTEDGKVLIGKVI